MACPVDGRYTVDLFESAMENLDLWEAGFCAFGAPMGELVVGTIIYSGFALNMFIRTGSVILPFILALVLGGTIFAQVMSIINLFTGVIILIVAPLVITAVVWGLDIRS